MGFITYVGLLLNRAAQNSVVLTDRLTVLIVPFATLGLWWAGAKMTASIQETLLLGVAITVLVVVALRLIAASYFVWKEDQLKKARLRAELDAPGRQSEIAMADFVVSLRKALSDKLATLASLAARPPSWRDSAKDEPLIKGLVKEIDKLINQLSYDTAVRIAAIRFRQHCLRLITGEMKEGHHFWKHRQITFRLLHKEDWISDIMSLMELEILLEQMGEKDFTEGADEIGAIEELKQLMRELGETYYDPKVREQIKQGMRNPARQ